jgi:hypothetical protein
LEARDGTAFKPFKSKSRSRSRSGSRSQSRSRSPHRKYDLKRHAKSLRERQKEEELKTELAKKRRSQGSVLLTLLQGTVTENRHKDFYQVEAARKQLRKLDPYVTRHDVMLMSTYLNPADRNKFDKDLLEMECETVSPPRSPNFAAMLPTVNREKVCNILIYFIFYATGS